MRRPRMCATGLVVVLLMSALPVWAGVVAHPARPITHAITVQPIRVQSSDGSTSAPVFGGDGSYAEGYIKYQVNVILAQSGIIAGWLPVVDYRSSFALNGHPGNYQANPRPQNHLNTILQEAPSPPRHPDPLVLNMFFVEIAPGFPNIGPGSVGGIAKGDSNGMIVAVGAGLLTWIGGLDSVSTILAHEIGHNLGLVHYLAGADNLMAASSAASGKLTPEQTSIIFTNQAGTDGFEFLRSYVPPTRYHVWAAESGVAGGPGDDDDHDGLPNVLEFLLLLDPRTADSHAMPVPSWGSGGLTWSIPKQADAIADGLVYAIETSLDGITWLPAGTPGSGSTVLADDASTLTVRLDSGSETALMRLAVEIVPGLLPAGPASPPPAREDLQPALLPGIVGCAHPGCEWPGP